MAELRVLVLEDDPLTASAYAEYLRRIPGVRAEHTVTSVAAARQFLDARLHAGRGFGVDLVLVDMNLPDGHGLDVLRRMRAAGWRGGAVALTAAAERDVVRGALALGITGYLLKPFTFVEFAERINDYRALHAQVGDAGVVSGQTGLDAIFGTTSARPIALPKGLTLATLDLVREALAAHPGAASATEVAQVLGLSRVTARRYLEHLVDTGQAERGSRHGTPGRPEVEYRPR